MRCWLMVGIWGNDPERRQILERAYGIMGYDAKLEDETDPCVPTGQWVISKGRWHVGIVASRIGVSGPHSTDDAKLVDAVKQLKSRVDGVVVIDRSNLEHNKRLAKELEGYVAVIFGGTESVALDKPIWVQNVALPPTSEHGKHVTVIDFELKEANDVRALRATDVSLVPVALSIPEDPIVKSWVDEYLSRHAGQDQKHDITNHAEEPNPDAPAP